MDGNFSFAFGWLFGLCFALFALAFSGPLMFWLAKRSSFFRRLRRQRLLNRYAEFTYMFNASTFERYLEIKGEGYLSQSLPDNRFELLARKLWRRLGKKRNRRCPRR